MASVANSPVGPVEYLVIDFPNGILSEDFGLELDELATQGSVKLLDFVYLTRDYRGNIKVTELDDMEILSEFDGEIGGLIGSDDIKFVGEHLKPGSSAALLLFEDLWATPLAEAMVLSGGSLVEGVRIPQPLADAAISALANF
jgi:uncharacterized membrane protein